MNNTQSKIKETIVKINRLKRMIGSLYFHNGLKALNGSVDFQKFEITPEEIASFLKSLGLVFTRSTYDRKYMMTTWDNWIEVIANDIVKEVGYIKEFFDCDNHAFTFASLAGMLYGLTSAPPTYGDTNFGRHYFNIIVTKDKGVLNAHLYEPIRGTWTKIEKDEELIIGNMRYYPHHLHLF